MVCLPTDSTLVLVFSFLLAGSSHSLDVSIAVARAPLGPSPPDLLLVRLLRANLNQRHCITLCLSALAVALLSFGLVHRGFGQGLGVVVNLHHAALINPLVVATAVNGNSTVRGEAWQTEGKPGTEAIVMDEIHRHIKLFSASVSLQNLCPKYQ